jgi:hypothetical protein
MENKKINVIAIKIVKFCFVSSFILGMIGLIGSCGNTGKKEEVKKVEVIKTKEELRKEQVEKLFSAWDGSNLDLELHVKDRMNDPKSFEHVETRYKDLGDFIMVSMEFRGKNAFGGVVKNKVYAKIDIEGNILEVTNGN